MGLKGGRLLAQPRKTDLTRRHPHKDRPISEINFLNYTFGSRTCRSPGSPSPLVALVVERGGSASDSVRVHGYSGLVSGSKRSMGDRLGSNAHGLSFSAGKRQRGDGRKWSGVDKQLHDSRISRNDLRLKLLRKRLFKQTGGAVEERKRMTHENADAAARIRNNEEANFYSSQPTDGFRARSPPRNFDELRPASSFRAVDASRSGQFLRNGMVGGSQPTDSLLFTMKATPQAARPVAQFAPASGSMQKSSLMGDEPTVPGLLHRLGLGKYVIIFQAEEVDMTALKQMGDKDLKELGIPMIDTIDRNRGHEQM
ncbi:Sterile alpha motif domain-containing protein, partial [Prunus dulcis]